MANMTFAQMMDMANGTGAQMPVDNSPPMQNDMLGLGNFTPPTAAPTVAPPQFQTFDHSAAIAGLPQAGGNAQQSAEQLRHSLSQLTATLQGGANAGPGAPAAPPLAQLADNHAELSPSAAMHAINARHLALGEINRGTAMEKYSGSQLMGNVDANANGEAQVADATGKEIEIKRQQDNEQNAIDAGATAKAKEQEDRVAAIANRGQIAAEAQMKRVNAAADDAAQASVHNFWQDKSTGARVLGILSQAFAGAANGLAGNPSAPTPLDRVIQRDMEMQQANLQQKNRNLENQRGVLRDLYEQTGSQMQASTAMYVAAWKRIELQGAQLKTKFANPTADAAYEKVQGLAQQRIADATNKTFESLRSTSIQQQEHGINTLAETERTDMMAGGTKEVGENAKIYHLAGTKGGVDERTYKQFKDEDQNYRQFVKQGEHVDWLFKHGSGENGADWQDYNGARSSMFATLRQMQKTGAALSDAELANAEHMLPSLAKGEVPGLAWITNARNMMTRIMATASRGHLSQLDGSIEGVTLDPNDVRFGHHVRNYVRQQATEAQARQSDQGDQ